MRPTVFDPDISTSDAMALLHRGEDDPLALDRRRFLQLIGMGVGAGLVTGGPGGALLGALVPGHDPSAWAAGPIGVDDGVLVIIGMFGGNDGLNTVVPLNDPLYRDQHGGLAIDPGDTLALDGDVGLNPHLTELKRWWDRGQLAIVDGIGYPTPDLSHFNSMAYWMAGSPNQIPTSGWIGRWLDDYLGTSKDLYAAAEVGSSVPLHLVGARHRGTVVPPSRPSFGASTEGRDLRQYDAIRAMRSTTNGPWFDAVSQAFVDQLDLAKILAPVIPESDALPTPEIVARLEVAARLINANLGFRVLTAGWGDFDSHAGQPAQHDARMQELNAAIRRFFEVLQPGWLGRVTVMTFSEFGRTSWDNDGAGTDHGTAAPHFVIGQHVRGGRYGQRPSLAGLRRWDRMAHHVDMRSYYGSIIDGWLGGGSSDVLGGNFEDLRLFSSPPRGGTAADPALPPAVVTPAATFFPLAPARIADTRDGTGGVPQRRVRAAEHLSVKVTGRHGVPTAGVTAVVANVTSADATQPMYMTVYPGGTDRPDTSNINGGPGRPVPNLVVMGVGADGTIDVFNSHGESHCIVDVFGYFADGTGDRFNPLAPQRLFDTRSGLGVRAGHIRHRTPVDVQVAGRAGVPPSGATAVVLNLTATEPTAPGWLRAVPAGASSSTSNVNFFRGDTVPNLVVCRLGAGGKLTVESAGDTHAIGDVSGWFGAAGSRLQAIPPERLLDTRSGTGAAAGPVSPRRTVDLVVAGRATVPKGATAVVLNVAATGATGPTFVTAWPGGGDRPATSNLNVMPGQTIANLVICRVGDGGVVSITSPKADCHVIADALGFFVD